MLEIERKFILCAPEVSEILTTASSIQLMIQWYVFGKSEFRLRFAVENNGKYRWIKTVKTGEGLIREEEESELNESEIFSCSINFRESRCVVKTRHVYLGSNYEGVIDRYLHPDIGYIAEIEMRGETSADLMPLPCEIWCLKPQNFIDVTDDRRYTAQAMSEPLGTAKYIDLMKAIPRSSELSVKQFKKFEEMMAEIYR